MSSRAPDDFAHDKAVIEVALPGRHVARHKVDLEQRRRPGQQATVERGRDRIARRRSEGRPRLLPPERRAVLHRAGRQYAGPGPEHKTRIVLHKDEPALGIDDKARDILVIGREPDKAEVVAVWHAPVETSGAELQPRAVPADRRGFEIGKARRVDLIDEERAPARGEEPQRGENDERESAADQDTAHISEQVRDSDDHWKGRSPRTVRRRNPSSAATKAAKSSGTSSRRIASMIRLSVRETP